MVIEVGDAVLDVHDKEDDVGLVDGELHLLVDFLLKDVLAVHYPAACVDD